MHLKQGKERRSNASAVATVIEHTPFLADKVQFGKAHSNQRQSLLEEHVLRGADVDAKEKITVTNKMLLDNEYPKPTTDPNEKKHFLPKFITAMD